MNFDQDNSENFTSDDNSQIKLTDEQMIQKFLHNDKINFCKPLPYELKCKLCSKVLTNSYIGPCGCVFCKKCIFDFIENNSKCPSNGELCNEIEIDTNNVFPNISSDIKVKKLSLKCINEGCEENITVKDILKHLEECDFSIVQCKFKKFGCGIGDIRRSVLKCHMTNYGEKHAEMMLNFQEEHNVKKMEKLIKENENEKCEIDELKNEVKKSEKLMEENENLKCEIDIFKNKIKEMEKLIKENENLKKGFEILKEEKRKFMIEHARSMDFNSQSYYWIVEDFWKKYESGWSNNSVKYESPEFYLQGYKLVMVLYPYYSNKNRVYYTCASIKFVLGDYDNHLKWPCDKNFVITLLMNSGQTQYGSFSFNGDYLTSIPKIGDAECEMKQLIQTNSILAANSGLIKNGCIKLRCEIVDTV